MTAYAAILEALMVRARTGAGAILSVSLFDAMADWMTVPLLQYEGGAPPQRLGLAHPSIAPYGVFASKEGIALLISVQNDREWRLLAGSVLGDAALAADPDFATNAARVERRDRTDRRVAAGFAAMEIETLSAKLAAADIAFARINDMAGLARHPQLRRMTLNSPNGPISYPAPAPRRAGETRHYAAIPALGEHTEKVRAEFLGEAARQGDRR
jgi:formyl-CoA transferase